MRIAFVHCHGSGNDFPLVDARGLVRDDRDWAQVARALADRRGPVGGDGLLLLTASDAAHAFGMRMFNSDGSEAETCLNGLRCVARAGFDASGIRQARVRLATSSAEVSEDVELAPGVVTIRETAAPADLDVARFPVVGERGELIDRPISMLSSERRFTAVSMPNPHLVTFVDAVDEAELVTVGTACQTAPWLPNRANVSFVEVRGGDTLFVRTFERGVGLTDSCGSAMAAASYAACRTGRASFGQWLTVRNRGGLVRVTVGEDAMVTVSGNATWQWAGSAEVDLERGVASDLVVDARFDGEIDAWTRAVDALR